MKNNKCIVNIKHSGRKSQCEHGANRHPRTVYMGRLFTRRGQSGLRQNPHRINVGHKKYSPLARINVKSISINVLYINQAGMNICRNIRILLWTKTL